MKPIAKLRTARHALRGVAPGIRSSSIRRVLIEKLMAQTRRIRRRMVTAPVRVVDLVSGAQAANRFFWRRSTMPTWFDVQRRLEQLNDSEPDQVEHFVREGLETVADPVLIANLARHPYSTEVVGGWLQWQVEAPSAAFEDRLRASRLLGGTFSGAAQLLLDEAQASIMRDWTGNLYQSPDDRLFQFIDSFGIHLAVTDKVPSLGQKDAPLRHRLVIAESLADHAAVALLLPGAAKVTLISTSDTFGRADFSKYLEWPGVGEISVEHVRTRITRFSPKYIEIHETTAKLAQRVIDEASSYSSLIGDQESPFLALEIADWLFFRTLRQEAVTELIADTEFDDIVIVTKDQLPSSGFIRMLGRIPGLATDERIRLVSTSPSAKRRSQFWSLLNQLADPPAGVPMALSRLPQGLVENKLEEQAQQVASTIAPLSSEDKPTILVVTSARATYTASTAAYIAELHTSYHVGVLHLGGNASALARLIGESCDPSHAVPLAFLMPSHQEITKPWGKLLAGHLQGIFFGLEHAITPVERSAADELNDSLGYLATSVIAPATLRLRSAHHWFRQNQESGTLPELVFLTPNRVPSVAAFTAVARVFGVPTIVAEPHMLDANYSRYTKVGADYYAAVSEYFRQQAASGFGMSLDRTVAVGTPRLIAPPAYDPHAAREAARADYSDEHGATFHADVVHLVFFCQPSAWDHVSVVWQTILEAAERSDCRILLKTHPEESPSRVEQYLQQANKANLSHNVTVLDCDAAVAVDLADLALTMYSAAAIDALIRELPVVCVSSKGVTYPVDLPAMIGVPLVNSVDELSELLAEFKQNPDEARKRVQLFLQKEPQFIEGPGPRLRSLVERALANGADGIRDESESPTSCFLDPPHPVYNV